MHARFSSDPARPALYEAYIAARDGRATPFTTPGHKRRRVLADDLLVQDVPLATGIEAREFSGRFVESAEAHAARLWGADHCRFGVSGSTQGNQALSLAITQPGTPVAVSRLLHKSLLAGLVLSGASPVWIYPSIEPETGLPLSVDPHEIERVASAQVTSVFLVEPTYFGVLADLEEIRRRLRPRRTPLVVDQAWGSHLGFHPELPQGAMRRGADAAVLSIHKTLPGFTQASITLVNTDSIDQAAFDAAFDALATTSPSAAILASIDRARTLLETDGAELLGRLIKLAALLRQRANAIPGVTTLDRLTSPGTLTDPTKVVIFTNGAGVRGYDIEDDLWERGIRIEMSERDFVIPLLTIADTEEEVELLATELERAIERRRSSPQPATGSAHWITPTDAAMTPRQAFFAQSERVDTARAVGRIAAEAVVPYPPGIPAIVPGEVISSIAIDGLREARAAGARIAYCADATLETIQVVQAGLRGDSRGSSQLG